MATPAASSSYACAAAPPPQSASNQEDDIFQEMLANHMNAPILPAHLMPERQASVQAALCTTRANNFPPANSQQQRYGPDELHYNAQQLGVSLEQIPLSRSPGRVHPCLFRTVDTLQEMIRKERQAHWTDGKAPCEVRMSRFVETKIGEHTQLGVFAIRDIKKGEYIDHYADCVCLSSQIQSSTWVRKVKGGQSFDTVTDGASLAWLYTRYVSSTAAGLQEMRNLPASAFWPLAAAVGDKVMQRFQELPVGCMVNSASSEYCAGRDLTNVLSQTKTYKACEYTLLIASRDIDQGDELLTRYYSHEETLLRGGWPPQPEPFAPAVRLYNCRATREFAAGAFIGWLWGMLATHGEWSDMTGVPAHDSHEAARRDKRKAAAAENFLQAIRLGIWRCLPVRTLKECNETNLTRLIVSERCPMAHLGAAVAGSTQANASLPRGDALTLQLDDPATCFRGLVVHATRAIAVGDIILIDQGGWTPQAWVERQAMAAGPSAPLAASASASSSISYLLPADLACTKRRKQDQQRQWENLKRFVEDNLAEYDSFPYAPFTASTGVDLSTVHVALGPSLLHPGILGVRLKPASHTTDGLVLSYPGVVMPGNLFNLFASQWHCPTGVRVPNLDTEKEKGITLVGDPRSFGANLNDPKGAKPPQGTIFARVREQEAIHLPPFGPATVPDDFVHADISAAALNSVENFVAPDGFKGEVLYVYCKKKDEDMFWIPNSEPYCAICFGKTQSAHNSFVSCPAEGCEQRCHRGCCVSPPTYLCHEHS